MPGPHARGGTGGQDVRRNSVARRAQEHKKKVVVVNTKNRCAVP